MSKALNDRLRKAFRRYRAGDLAGAQQACAEILRRFPNHPEALHLQGVLHLERGNAREAVEWIRRAVERDTHNPAVAEAESRIRDRTVLPGARPPVPA